MTSICPQHPARDILRRRCPQLWQSHVEPFLCQAGQADTELAVWASANDTGSVRHQSLAGLECSCLLQQHTDKPVCREVSCVLS